MLEGAGRVTPAGPYRGCTGGALGGACTGTTLLRSSMACWLLRASNLRRSVKSPRFALTSARAFSISLLSRFGSWSMSRVSRFWFACFLLLAISFFFCSLRNAITGFIESLSFFPMVLPGFSVCWAWTEARPGLACWMAAPEKRGTKKRQRYALSVAQGRCRGSGRRI